MKKTILITQKSCPGCRQVKAELADSLASGEIEEIPIESSRGQLIADELDLDAVPECIEEEDGKFTKCDLEALIESKGKHKH